jgi:hypothetical protein
MQIGLVASDKEHLITHDLNFQQNRYESKHVIVSTLGAILRGLRTCPISYFRISFCPQTFKNPKPALLVALRDSGPVPGDENGVKSKRSAAAEEGSKKKKRIDKNVSHLWQEARSSVVVVLLMETPSPLNRSTWTNSQTDCRNWVKMTSSRWFKWFTTTNHPILIRRTTLNVSLSSVSVSLLA